MSRCSYCLPVISGCLQTVAWRGAGGQGGQLPPGTELRGAPKCLDVYYIYHCNAYRIISRGKAYVNALMFID